MQNERSSESKNERSIGVRASNNENSDSEKEDNPLDSSELRDIQPQHYTEMNQTKIKLKT